MFSFRTLCSTCALLALSAGPGFATVVTYTDLTSWQNATLSGFNTITFDGFTGIGSSKQYSTGLSLGNGLSFEGFDAGYPANIWIDNYAPGDNPNSNDANFNSGPDLRGTMCCAGNPYIYITLPTAVTSVGFDIMTYDLTSGISFNAALNNLPLVYTSAPTLPWSGSNTQRAFLGFTSDTPITSIQLSLPYNPVNNGVYPVIDNFSYGSADSGATDTPEACTMLLIGLGLTGMAGLRRRLSRIASAMRQRPEQLKPQTN